MTTCVSHACFCPRRKGLLLNSSSKDSASRTERITHIAVIAALYAATTLVCLLFLGGLAWGPVQFRLSGLGALGMLDVVFGSIASMVGASICYRLREHPRLAVLGPILANALIVPTYLPLMLQGLGFYTIPFTSISLDGAYIPMYLFGAVAIGIGEGVVIYVLGLSLAKALEATPLAARLRDGAANAGETRKA